MLGAHCLCWVSLLPVLGVHCALCALFGTFALFGTLHTAFSVYVYLFCAASDSSPLGYCPYVSTVLQSPTECAMQGSLALGVRFPDRCPCAHLVILSSLASLLLFSVLCLRGVRVLIHTCLPLFVPPCACLQRCRWRPLTTGFACLFRLLVTTSSVLTSLITVCDVVVFRSHYPCCSIAGRFVGGGCLRVLRGSFVV